MELSNQLHVSSSPHIRCEDGTRSIMLDVVIALLFPLIMAIYFFGWRSLTLTATAVASSIAFEWLYRYLLKKPSSVHDLSAVVTGMLIAFNLPVSAPLWIPVVGSFFAIVIVKQLYGGLGKNFVNPALAARAFLMLCWTGHTSLWVKPLINSGISLFGNVTADNMAVDAIASATPLAKMAAGSLPSTILPSIEGDISYTLRDTFIGNVPGCIGEVSAIVLLAALVYLLIRKVITIHIPLAYVGTVALITFIFPLGGCNNLQWMLYSISSGGLMLGAVFMATDYVTSPVSATGRVIYGIGCGLLTVLIRYFGSYSEGVSCAILIMNLCVWSIDKYIKPRRFGVKRFVKKANTTNNK